MNSNRDNLNSVLRGWLGFKSHGSNFSLFIFLICLLFSTILWFINALSKSYTTTISHPVEYVNLPKNRFFVNSPPQKLNLTIKAHGFTLARYKLIMSFIPLNLNISDLVKESPESLKGLYIVPASYIKSTVETQLGNDIQLLEINPGAFTMAFDTLGVRHVPVASKVYFNFKPRYGLTSGIRLNPSVVTISGDRNSIENIDSIYTVTKYLKNQDAAVSFEIALEIPPMITVEPRYITLSAPIEEYTEKNFQVPVGIEHQPDNVKVRLFPHEVDVRFSVGLASFPLVQSEDFDLYVSWEDIANKTPVLKVKVRKQPVSVKSLIITPENVEYLIEKN